MFGRATIRLGIGPHSSYPDGVAPSRLVSVSASVIFSCTIKAQKKISSSGASSPGSPEKGP